VAIVPNSQMAGLKFKFRIWDRLCCHRIYVVSFDDRRRIQE